MKSIVSGAVFLCVAAASSAFGDFTLVSGSGVKTLAKTDITESGWKWDFNSSGTSILTFSGEGGVYALSGTPPINNNNTRAVAIEVSKDTTLTISNLTIDVTATGGGKRAGIRIKSPATLNLVIGEGTSTITGYGYNNTSSSNYDGFPGIQVNNGAALVISGGDNGALNALGGKYSAGIGGCTNMVAGAITINSGNVSAKGGIYGAGIGSGYASTSSGASSITINGGNITATGGAGLVAGEQAPAIGCGYIQQGATSKTSFNAITISGGTITATGNIGTPSNNGPYTAGSITLSPNVETTPIAFTTPPTFDPACSLRVEIPAGLAGGTYPLVSGLAAAPASTTITGREGSETIFTPAEGSEPSLLSIRVPDGGAGGTMIFVF